MNRLLLSVCTSILIVLFFIDFHTMHVGPVDLTASAHVSNGFTDNRGFVSATNEANNRCMMLVYISGRKISANHFTAPLDTPDRIYMQCMAAHGMVI